MAAASIAIVAFLGLLAFALLTNSPVTGNSGATRVDKPAPDFSLVRLDGGVFDLSENLGRPVLINFWASWCPPCIREAPVLEAAWREFGDRGVVFVGVDIQDTEQEANRFVEAFNVTYTNVIDPDGTVTVDYGVIGLPVTFFVDREGIIVRRWVGALKARQLDEWLDQLLAGGLSDDGADPDTDGEGVDPDEYFKFE